MQGFAERGLTYHHSEVARLTAAIALARPNARRTGLLRAVLKFHQDILARGEQDPLH